MRAGTVCRVRITAELSYDAEPATVFAMICDTAFQERKCRESGAVEHEVQVASLGDGRVRITTHRTLPADGVPNAVRSFVGATLRVTQTDEWSGPQADGSRTGTTVAEIAGAPIRFTAALRLEAGGPGARQAMAGDLKAAVPLLGGRIEKAAEPAIMAAVRAEQRTSTAWLTER